MFWFFFNNNEPVMGDKKHYIVLVMDSSSRIIYIYIHRNQSGLIQCCELNTNQFEKKN